MDAIETESVDELLPRFWPPVLEQGRVADRAFATAYAALPDRNRAWIKTGLAALYAALGGPMPLAVGQERVCGHDLSLATRETPLDFVLVACGPGFASPARLMAAVLPALCARVPEVAAVRVGGAWPKPLLTTLELCGIESAFRLGARAFAGLGKELAGLGRGAIVVLDGLAAPATGPTGPQVFHARVAGRVGIFPEADTPFDWDALAFAQPDLTLCVHGGSAPDQAPFVAAAGTLADAAGLGYDAVYVGDAKAEAALAVARLSLGPGRETLWLWPQLGPEVFRRRHWQARVHAR